MSYLNIFKRVGKTATHDRNAYWDYQRKIGHYYLENFVLPIITSGKVLDIGCAEGGVLSVFHEAGFDCLGIELNEQRVEFAREKYNGQIQFFHENIESFRTDEPLDLVIMFDVIEHVFHKDVALGNIRSLLKPDGRLIVTFPPFRSAFGGHQQILSSFLKFIPYWHLLPRNIYVKLYEKFESDRVALGKELYDTGITIKEFKRLIKEAGLSVEKQVNYWIRPRQSFRFGMAIKQNKIPIFEEFLTTGVTFVLQPAQVEPKKSKDV